MLLNMTSLDDHAKNTELKTSCPKHTWREECVLEKIRPPSAIPLTVWYSSYIYQNTLDTACL